MSGTLFKGYSQKTELSGNLLKGEDRSDKILEEGRNYLQKWKDVSQGERETQQSYLTGLETSFNRYKDDLKSWHKLEQYYADSFKGALVTRHEGLLQNAKNKLTAKQETAKKLQGWSENATKIAAQGANQLVKSQQNFGMNLAIDLGLSWETAQGIQAAEGVLDDTYAGTNAAVLEARKRGASWEQINQIHKLSFLGNQGFRVGVAQNVGENYAMEAIIGKSNDKFPTVFGTMSLNEATQIRNQEAVEVILREIRTQHLNDSKEKLGINDKLLSKYARESIIRAEGRVLTTVKEAIAKDQQALEETKSAKLTQVRVKEGKWKELLVSKFGPNNEYRAGALSSETNNIANALQLGLLNNGHLEEVLDTKFKINGKLVRFEDQWPKRAQQLRNAESDFLNKEAARLNSHKKNRDAILNRDTNKLRSDLLSRETPIKASELATMIGEANRLYGPENAMSSMLQSFVESPQEAANDIVYVPTLEKLKSLGLVTTSIVKSYNLTPETEATWLQTAKEQDKTQPNEAEEKLLNDWVDGKVEGILHGYGYESEDVPSAAMASYRGKETIKKYFTMFAKDKTLSRQDVLDKAIERWEVDVARDYKITETGTGNNYQPHFGTFSVSAKRSPVPLSEVTAEYIATNPRLPYEKVLLKPVDVVKFFTDVSQGRNVGFPADVSHYVSKFGLGPNGEVKMTELMFLEAQMKLIDPKFEIPKELLQMHKLGFSKIDPRYQKYIVGAHANVNSVHVGLRYSGLSHDKAGDSNNYSDKNSMPLTSSTTQYTAPENLAWYLNLDPDGEDNQLDWTERLVGGYYG